MITAQGSARRDATRSNGRAAGAPLTVILAGETMPGTEDGPPAAYRWRVPGYSTTRAALTYLHATDERQRSVADAVGTIAQAAMRPAERHASGRHLARWGPKGR
jgi:hypothetical protein